MSSQGIQGQDKVPRQIAQKYATLFETYLPGWEVTREYSFHAATSTQTASVQLNWIMHSGSHKWLSDSLNELLANFKHVVKKSDLLLHSIISGLADAETLEKMGARKGRGA